MLTLKKTSTAWNGVGVPTITKPLYFGKIAVAVVVVGVGIVITKVVQYFVPTGQPDLIYNYDYYKDINSKFQYVSFNFNKRSALF